MTSLLGCRSMPTKSPLPRADMLRDVSSLSFFVEIWRFPKMGYPKTDGSQWEILLKLMIWIDLGVPPHFRKPLFTTLSPSQVM